MADPQQQPNYYHHTKQQPTSSSHLMLLATLVPFGASLLILSGLTLAATVIVLAVATPLFFIFSPVLVPAALVIGLAVAGFLTSGAFGVTSLSSFAWIASYLRRSRLQEQLQHAQTAKEAGENVLSNAQIEAHSDAESDGSQSDAPSVVQTDEQSEAQSKARKSGKTQEEKRASS